MSGWRRTGAAQARHTTFSPLKPLSRCLLLALLVSLTSCSPYVTALQGSLEATPTLLGDTATVGQTFVAPHGGLNGIDVWLFPPESASGGELRLHLRAAPGEARELATATLPLAQVTAPGFYRFAFDPLPDSHHTYYYAFWEVIGNDAPAAFGIGPARAYLNGSLYRHHTPVDAQLTFRLAHAPAYWLRDLLKAAATFLAWVGAAALLYVLPGWALLVWVWRGRRLTLGETLGVACGTGLALIPLLFLWTHVVGIQLGRGYGYVLIGGSVVSLLWYYKPWTRSFSLRESYRRLKSMDVWPSVILLGLLGLTFLTRLLAARGLAAPLWGDAYQHATIVQLMLDQQGLFESWLPYVPYQSLSVHFGFHATVSVFAWLTGLDAVQATLQGGQLLNALAALTLFPLAVKIARGNRWAGVGAALLCGLLSTMPAYYLNWGRYPQLAGQVILPVALWWLWEAAEGSQQGIDGVVILAATALAGMTLTYYRMPFYYATFVPAWLLSWLLLEKRDSSTQWLRLAGAILAVGVIAITLFLPWGLRVRDTSLMSTMLHGRVQHVPAAAVWQDYLIWRDIAFYVPLPLVILFVVAHGVALSERRWDVVLLGGWVVLLASLVLGHLINLPGANMMQNFAIMIALYIPASLGGGWLLGRAMALVQSRSPSTLRVWHCWSCWRYGGPGTCLRSSIRPLSW